MARPREDWRRLGRTVAAERARLGISVAALAAEAGISARTLENIEAGARTAYRHTTLSRIEDVLGWEPGSVAAVVAGEHPQRTRDPLLERVRTQWLRLTPTQQRALAALIDSIAVEQ